MRTSLVLSVGLVSLMLGVGTPTPLSAADRTSADASGSVLSGLLARLPATTTLATAQPSRLRAAARSLALERAANDPDALPLIAAVATAARADPAGRLALVEGLLDGVETLARTGRIGARRATGLTASIQQAAALAPSAQTAQPAEPAPALMPRTAPRRAPSPYPQPPGYRPPYAPQVGAPESLMNPTPSVPASRPPAAVPAPMPPGVARPDPRTASSGF